MFNLLCSWMPPWCSPLQAASTCSTLRLNTSAMSFPNISDLNLSLDFIRRWLKEFSSGWSNLVTDWDCQLCSLTWVWKICHLFCQLEIDNMFGLEWNCRQKTIARRIPMENSVAAVFLKINSMADCPVISSSPIGITAVTQVVNSVTWSHTTSCQLEEILQKETKVVSNWAVKFGLFFVLWYSSPFLNHNKNVSTQFRNQEQVQVTAKFWSFKWWW